MEKNNEIKTDKLEIYKNILEWEDSIIQLSNVSQVSTKPMELQDFPKWTIIVCIVGLCVCEMNPAISIIAWFIAGIGIWLWYSENERLKTRTILTLKLNAGNNVLFVFNNKEFLKRVWEVLKQIIADGNEREADVVINIKDNYLSDNAGIFKEFKIN
ncbi:MAG: hypothetical protein Q4D45_00630 [Lachnospiraceae bacterium]|nr:hypothetical protein [Lachnospiraceae bacterium]